MYKSRSSLHTILLALAAFALACPTPRGNSGGGGDDDDDDAGTDDDDFSNDDDDATDDDDGTDDDDFTTDDDDFTGDFETDGMAFSMEFTALTGVNDTVTITGSYTVKYYIDIDNGIENCDQVVNFEAQYVHGDGELAGCTNCSGYVFFNQAAFQDVSNPNLDPEHCLPADLDAAGFNYGHRLTAPADPNAVPPNFGDFGDDLGIIDQERHQTLGIDWAKNAKVDRTRAGAEAHYNQYQLDYTHTGLVNATPNSLSGQAGLSTISEAEAPGSLYLGAWEIYINAQLNSNTDSPLDGGYAGQASFILTFNQEG